jgi:hypothetical protein
LLPLGFGAGKVLSGRVQLRLSASVRAFSRAFSASASASARFALIPNIPSPAVLQ